MQSTPPAGRTYVLGIIAIYILFSLSTIILTNLVGGFERIGTQSIRFLLTLGLCFFLYQGRNWARWLAGILFGLGGVFGLLSGIAILPQTPFALILVVQGLTYLICVGVLFFQPSVRAYFLRSDTVM